MKALLHAVLICTSLMLSQVQAAESPQDLVINTADKVLSKLKAEKELIDKEPDRVYSLINEYVLPHFDFERMSRWVLGKYWRKASAKQQTQFVEEFRTLLVRTYASSLLSFTDQKIIYQPFRDKETDEEVTVRSEVEQPGGFPIPINYRLHLVNGQWKVFDVTIDDISLVANYRTSFSKEIRQSSIDALIKKLSDQNQQAKK